MSVSACVWVVSGYMLMLPN